MSEFLGKKTPVETVLPCHRTDHCGTSFLFEFRQIAVGVTTRCERVRCRLARLNIVALADRAARLRESLINDQSGDGMERRFIPIIDVTQLTCEFSDLRRSPHR
jgi:hypothetical protein